MVAATAEWLSTHGSSALANAISDQESDETAELAQTAPLSASPLSTSPSLSVTQQLDNLDDEAAANAVPAPRGRTEATPLSARTTLPDDAGPAEKAKSDLSAARELTQTQELDALLDEVRNV